MSTPVERELNTEELALLDSLHIELKEYEIHLAALRDIKARLKALAQDAQADFLTVDGKRVIQVIRTHPTRFDTAGFKAFDPRTYETFMRPTDDTVVTLRVLKGQP